MNLLGIGLGGLVAILVALGACRIGRLHPMAKVWVCRLAMLRDSRLDGLRRRGSDGRRRVFPLGELILLAIWALGCAVVAFHGLRAYVAAWRLARMAVPAGEVAGLRVRQAGYLPEPCVVGVFRPTLLTPIDREIDPAVIGHELAHVRHGDALLGAVAWASYAVAWFIPGCGRLVAEHSLWEEVWADLDARTRLGLAPKAQANALLGAASRSAGIPSAALGYGGDARVVARRIEAMFAGGYSRGLAAALTILALATAVPLRPRGACRRGSGADAVVQPGRAVDTGPVVARWLVLATTGPVSYPSRPCLPSTAASSTPAARPIRRSSPAGGTEKSMWRL